MVSRQLDAQELLAHAGFVRAVARALLAPDRADDVVQETMLAAVRNPPRGRLKPWLAAVARRLALKDRRREARIGGREQRAARAEAILGAAESVAQLEMHRRLVDAVLALEEPYRTTVVQRYFHGRKPADIARDGDVSVRTVETRLRRARAQLRARLDERSERWRAVLLPLAGGALMTKTTKGIAVLVLLVVGTAATLGWRATRPDRTRPRAPETRGGVEASSVPPAPPFSAEAVAPPPESPTGSVPKFHPAPEAADGRLVGIIRMEPNSIPVPEGAYVELTGRTAAGLEVQRKVPIETAPWFRIDGVEPGVYELRAGAQRHSGGKPVHVTASADAPRWWRPFYSLPLRVAGRIRISVPPGTRVTARAGDRVALDMRSEDGEVVWYPDRTGQYVVAAGGVDRVLWYRPPENDDIVLAPESDRSGRLERFAGGWLRFEQGRQFTAVRIGEDGTFRVRGLGPATYDVVATGHGRLGILPEFEMRGTRGRLSLRFRPTRVSGQLLRPDGTPWGPGVAYASLGSGPYRVRTVHCGSEGCYEIVGALPGRYALRGGVGYYDYQQPRREIELSDNEPLEVDFTIGKKIYGKLALLVRDERGAPVKKAQFSMWIGGTAWQYLDPKAIGNGEYEFRLEAGSRRLSVHGFKREFVVPANGIERAEWTLKPESGRPPGR